jgi:PAS domain S-box-containing protein/TyrR family helix-turn-helix protein
MMKQAIRCEKILDFSHHGIIATDKNGLIVFINHRAREIFKFGQKEFIGQKIMDVLPMTGALMMESIKSGKEQLGHQILGKRQKLMANVNAIKEDKKVIGAVCNFLNMEEFEAIARNLDAFSFLDQKFKTVFDASSDGIWICDSEGRVIEINKTTEVLGGITKKDVIGKKVSELVKKEGLYDQYVTDEVIRTKRHVSQLQNIKRTHKTVLCTGIPVLNDDGEVSLVVINERDITQLHAIREQLKEVHQEKERFRDEIAELNMRELKSGRFVAENEQMRQVIRTALKFSRIGVSDILLLGESGTGKGLLAKFIHNNSARARKPFIQINCAAIPESILEAELFGYEKGAFTGASQSGKPGLLELSHEGTLFLDEIGEMSLTVQAKLLKYLDDHEVMRLGGTRSKKIDSTLIAATNQNLEKRSRESEFRSDLFYRLNSLVIRIPPLRERPEDVFELANSFLEHFNQKYDLNKKINPLTLGLLQSHAFPGNVRELRNIIKTAVFTSDEDAIDSMIINSVGKEVLEEWSRITDKNAEINNLVDILSAFEKEILRNAVRRHKSTRKIARYLNISQPTVVRKLKKHGLSTA